MTPRDADQVLVIYQLGLDTGHASFETTAPTWPAFDTTKLPHHRYVATRTGAGPHAPEQVLGWIAATAVSDRCVYAGVVEHSVYIHPGARGRGVGAALLNAFVASTEAAGIWTIQSGIFPENTASLRLHHAAGFRTIGTRERIGRHHGRWRNVVLIERRSPTVL
ncbi:GNAT family N-acetyltransferase [Actinomadura alba]